MHDNQNITQKSRIILMGYMGSGKSTIGLLLAKHLNFDFVDLDQYISEKEVSTVPEIFKSKGEIYFRKKESLYLNEVLQFDNVVIALGGGTPCYAGNMALVASQAGVMSLYLKASIGLLAGRLWSERERRPLISHIDKKEELVEFIGKHLFERSQFYNLADVVVSIDGRNLDEIVEIIDKHLF